MKVILVSFGIGVISTSVFSRFSHESTKLSKIYTRSISQRSLPHRMTMTPNCNCPGSSGIYLSVFLRSHK